MIVLKGPVFRMDDPSSQHRDVDEIIALLTVLKPTENPRHHFRIG
jgi:hypothetical protein